MVSFSSVSVPARISEEQALSLVEDAIAFSDADGAFVSVSAGTSALSRFSDNQMTQNLSRTRFSLSVTSYVGERSATTTTTDLDRDAIQATVRRSRELAEIAPVDPEWVPLLEPQTYPESESGFDEATATCSAAKRGEWVRRTCDLSRQAGIGGSGTLSTDDMLMAIGNSTGLRASDRHTEAEFSFTARIDNGTGWHERTAWRLADLPIADLVRDAIARAQFSRDPHPVEPGTYPVVLAPAAVAELASWMMWNLDARAADEGRSFMSRSATDELPAGNRLGEQLFSPLVNMRRDFSHPLLRARSFFSNGLPNQAIDIVCDGMPRALSYSRYWAQQTQQNPTGPMSPFVMAGGDRSLEQLIADTECGILINRAWYVRYINPKTLEVTGMTRDGTAWIENGKIARPIQNLRFNQSLPELFRDIDALGAVERHGSCVVPSARSRQLRFDSVTDSI